MSQAVMTCAVQKTCRFVVSKASSHKSFWRLSDVLDDVTYHDIQRRTKYYSVKRSGGFRLTFYHENERFVDTSERHIGLQGLKDRQMELQNVFLYNEKHVMPFEC